VPFGDLIFPLAPRRRVIGLAFGAMHSARRGLGSDVAGSRPYRQGDDVDAIDWAASARLSSARGTDEFVVRERFADEAPRVIVVSDRRPQMALFPEPLPWLRKDEAMKRVTELVVASALGARGYLGYVDHGDGNVDEPYWSPPRAQRDLPDVAGRTGFAAPPGAVELAFEHLLRAHPPLPAGSFLFVLSDFLPPPPDAMWAAALERRWDVVPVVIQDPTWEQSFPQVAGVVVPIVDPASGALRLARFGRREAAARRTRNEQRLAALVESLRGLDLEPVLVSSAGLEEIFWQFVGWSEQRLFWRGQAV
jgi:uncharacterized protein (DUF58 family)